MVAARWVAILRQQEARRMVIVDLSIPTEGPRSEQK